MSLQSALQFIAKVREDPGLAARVRELGPGGTIDRLIAIAAEQGLDFTAEELRKAHKHDWVMRWGRYSSPRRPDLPT